MALANNGEQPRKISRDEIMQCSFPKWYPNFEKVTPLSFIIPLPTDFIEYLLSDDTLRLPGKPYKWDRKARRGNKDNDDDSEESDISWSDVEDEDELDEGATDVPAFEKLSRCVSKKIRKLGGCCFPKLDWSCPKDATWIGLNNSLMCSTFVDVCLFLKSSSFVMHDLTDPFEFCHTVPESQHKAAAADSSSISTTPPQTPPFIQHHLILRKWVEIEPSFEFRCFVKNHQLIAISQREVSQYYGYIVEQCDQIVRDVTSFFKEYIKERFPLRNYTFDVFRSRKDYVRLLDFNPFCSQTDGLLFNWPELFEFETEDDDDDDQPEFRYHTDALSLRPNTYREYALPADVLHFASGSSAEKLIDLMKIHDVQKANSTSGASDEEVDQKPSENQSGRTISDSTSS